MAVDDGELIRAMRAGRASAVVEVLEALPIERRTSLRRNVRAYADAMLSDCIGARDPAGHWAGELRVGHHDAAIIATLGTASLEQALRVSPGNLKIARDVIPRLFPSRLDEFVEAWSGWFLSNPKAWDRNLGIEAMFDWAQQGLIQPPQQQGALLLLLSQSKIGRYLADRPVLLTTTLPRLFSVPGIKGASAAQRDETALGESLGGRVIPRLIRQGYWEKDAVLNWCDLALSVPRSEYEYRWFRELKRRIQNL